MKVAAVSSFVNYKVSLLTSIPILTGVTLVIFLSSLLLFHSLVLDPSFGEPSMDDPKVQGNIDNIDGNNEMFKFPYVHEHGPGSQYFLINLLKYSLLLGADKFLMARKTPGSSVCVLSEPGKVYEDYDSAERRRKGKCPQQYDEKVCGNFECSSLHSCPTQFVKEAESSDKYFDSPERVEYSSKCNKNEFPVDIVAFLTLLVLKLAGFQISLLMRFLTLPYSVFNFWLTLLMFPFQTIALAREYVKQKLLRMWSNLCSRMISFICIRFKMPTSLLKLAVRFCLASFWSIYVCLVLVGFLLLGFVVSGITMRHLVTEPIQTTENLNFDYTKASPVAFVPLISSPIAGVSPGLISKDKIPFAKPVGGRSIPYNHKLQLTVSLAMPESEYNRNLGIFQVRVECLSADGKVTASSSYPSMLKFKSKPIQFVETMFKSITVLTGFQSEVQNLKVQEIDFTEGYEPTACFKVIIEQRAEYEPGFGIPEIYAASLRIDSELPRFKRILWNWRRTLFVWISIISFLTELLIALICFRPIIFPGRTLLVIGAKAKSHRNKISWNKSI